MRSHAPGFPRPQAYALRTEAGTGLRLALARAAVPIVLARHAAAWGDDQ